jgi:hypothetical protein
MSTKSATLLVLRALLASQAYTAGQHASPLIYHIPPCFGTCPAAISNFTLIVRPNVVNARLGLIMTSHHELIYPLQPEMLTSLYTPKQRLSVLSRVAFELERATNVLLTN